MSVHPEGGVRLVDSGRIETTLERPLHQVAPGVGFVGLIPLLVYVAPLVEARRAVPPLDRVAHEALFLGEQLVLGDLLEGWVEVHGDDVAGVVHLHHLNGRTGWVRRV